MGNSWDQKQGRISHASANGTKVYLAPATYFKDKTVAINISNFTFNYTFWAYCLYTLINYTF